ncbi:Alpha-glucosidase, glycosyl hydrolase family GH31 [Nocardioides terrae]|uniref:Alpha-glucosidase, glycosyl hydrolase family GH31 n=1 Tax=Nocardioides terrae TaxID=574651 RepID=A0A1I1KJT7_9ACTN|nr:TIM-barrel domain-containing protein [Nocardioides terrae]SFC57700.1 Alpha-glucosidase, glycosyl hydrolase family GH31 [Nocardioides terrae]
MSTRARWTRAGVAAVSAAAVVTSVLSTSGSPARADTPGSNVYTSGHARFEVLSSTLIRTEYSADGSFTDAPTFNAIGRDSFGSTTSTGEEDEGWFVITTPKATLKYKVGSGEFTGSNLILTEQAGQQKVTASPWAGQTPPTCDIGALCEAESMLLSGLGTAKDHSGYTGSGFAAGFEGGGSSASMTVDAATAGTYDFAARYANAKDGTTRTLSVSVDGGAAQTLSLPVTANWDTWGLARTAITLPAGKHVVTLSHGPSDTADINMDSVAVLETGAEFPTAAPPAASTCAFGEVCEAESGTLGGGAFPATDHNGYSGTSFVAGLGTLASDTVHVTGVPADGTYALQLRFASAAGQGDRPVSIRVGTQQPTTVSLGSTSTWDSWRTASYPVTLSAGDNDVALQCPNAASCGINVDTVAITAPDAPLLAAHAPLGGYRRGVDGVNGAAPTVPGLLYADGWYLLNDTASSIFDSSAKTVTARPQQSGTYQDGYVFAYGTDYDRALGDLATLTGPSELLPRWAYGVWYSEYYNRTASDYQDVIVPKFRSEGVPLDALVTDTDFKAPDVWDGWQVDTDKFPDPTAYFDWAHAQGIHTSLNIHPSVLDSDPQYAAAQATAGNTLTQNNAGCYSDVAHTANCYVFDWSDPNQLKAYFDLHDQMKQQGNDVWWLDWCCEQSVSSSAGVTPDAWINQNYKWYTDDTLGRGFNLARAFGSLQAGGQQAVPTGPWADKRSTVHFTGDSTSSWSTLAMEVGYTPGESASTGLSPVSHDIGGFNDSSSDPAGSEPGSRKIPDDLYARWVQLGAFQPILRLHGNHSDRLPWQYGTAAKESAESFLNLRENLVPYTYTLAQQAAATGVPVTRPLYLAYPNSQESYANAGSEYLYGPDVLVAPVTSAGMDTVQTRVWFPEGSSWTDVFTGKTYAGGTTAQVSTTLATMPVFLRSGGIMTTRTDDVTNDVQNPLDKVTVTVAGGAAGSSSLFEDDGKTDDSTKSATTALDYTEDGGQASLRIGAAQGGFTGQVTDRAWTVKFTNAAAPTAVLVDGVKQPASAWSYDAATRTITARVASRSVTTATTVSYRTVAANHAPTAGDVSTRTTVGYPVALTLTGTDVDGDPLTFSHSQPLHGTVTGGGATLRYAAAPTFVGTDSFTYTVSDPFGKAVTRTVTVAVGRQTPVLSVKRHGHGRAAVLKVRALLHGGVTAGRATVTVRVGKRVVAHGRLKHDKVTLKLSKLPRGKHTVVVTLKQGPVTTAASRTRRV